MSENRKSFQANKASKGFTAKMMIKLSGLLRICFIIYNNRLLIKEISPSCAN